MSSLACPALATIESARNGTTRNEPITTMVVNARASRWFEFITRARSGTGLRSGWAGMRGNTPAAPSQKRTHRPARAPHGVGVQHRGPPRDRLAVRVGRDAGEHAGRPKPEEDAQTRQGDERGPDGPKRLGQPEAGRDPDYGRHGERGHDDAHRGPAAVV